MNIRRKKVMQYGLYTIYDKVAEETGPIFEAKSDAVASRSARNLLSEVSSVDDFKLLRVGYSDKTTGVITCELVPVEINPYDLQIFLPDGGIDQ